MRQNPAFLKHILELINYYKFGVGLASIKHRIFGQIQDPVFLMENIIESKNSRDSSRPKYTTEQYLELYEVLEIYEFETHLDKVSTQISIGAVNMEHSSHEIYGEIAAPKTYPHSYSADVTLDIEDLKFSIGKVGATEEMVLKCATFLLGPQNRMTSQ